MGSRTVRREEESAQLLMQESILPLPITAGAHRNACRRSDPGDGDSFFSKKGKRKKKKEDEGGREKTRGPERDIANDVTQRSDIVSNPAESGWLRNMQRCVNAYCEQSRDAVTCSSAERERLVALMTTRKYTVGFRPRPPKHCKANCVFRLSLVRDRMVTRS